MPSSLTTAISQVDAAANVVTATARVSDSRCAVAANVIITIRNSAPSNSPLRPTASATGTITMTAKTSAGSADTNPRTAKATTANTSTSNSTASPGSNDWATTTISTAVPTRNQNSSRLVGISGRARSARHRPRSSTRRVYVRSGNSLMRGF